MATEEGVVTRVDSATAWVTTKRSDACESCSSKGSCSTLGGGKEMEVEALNIAGAKPGDRVVISFESSALFKLSFLLYIFPILCMIAGALLGQKTASFLHLNATALSVVSAFLFFFLAFLFVRAKGNRLSQKDQYRPKITRKLKRP